jgi:hypothetical protein
MKPWLIRALSPNGLYSILGTDFEWYLATNKAATFKTKKQAKAHMNAYLSDIVRDLPTNTTLYCERYVK